MTTTSTEADRKLTLALAIHIMRVAGNKPDPVLQLSTFDQALIEAKFVVQEYRARCDIAAAVCEAFESRSHEIPDDIADHVTAWMCEPITRAMEE